MFGWHGVTRGLFMGNPPCKCELKPETNYRNSQWNSVGNSFWKLSDLWRISKAIVQLHKYPSDDIANVGYLIDLWASVHFPRKQLHRVLVREGLSSKNVWFLLSLKTTQLAAQEKTVIKDSHERLPNLDCHQRLPNIHCQQTLVTLHCPRRLQSQLPN